MKYLALLLIVFVGCKSKETVVIFSSTPPLKVGDTIYNGQDTIIITHAFKYKPVNYEIMPSGWDGEVPIGDTSNVIIKGDTITLRDSVVVSDLNWLVDSLAKLNFQP